MGMWPRGVLEFFLQAGVLRETEPSGLVWLWECVDRDWISHEWTPDASRGGKMIGVYYCPYGCGAHEVGAERCRQWAPSIDGVIAAVARAVGGTVKEIVPQRIALVGTMIQDGAYRELFLLRGGGWPDAAAVIGGAERLLRSPAPAVLAMDVLPPETIWIGRHVPTISLAEALCVRRGRFHLDLATLVTQANTGVTVGGVNWLTVTEAAELLMRDLPGLNLDAARARVSVAASRGAFRTNNLKREQRRVEATSFSAWRLTQRDKDLDAEDNE